MSNSAEALNAIRTLELAAWDPEDDMRPDQYLERDRQADALILRAAQYVDSLDEHLVGELRRRSRLLFEKTDDSTPFDQARSAVVEDFIIPGVGDSDEADRLRSEWGMLDVPALNPTMFWHVVDSELVWVNRAFRQHTGDEEQEVLREWHSQLWGLAQELRREGHLGSVLLLWCHDLIYGIASRSQECYQQSRDSIRTDLRPVRDAIVDAATRLSAPGPAQYGGGGGELPPPGMPNSVGCHDGLEQHTEDYRWVKWYGEEHNFSKPQAEVVKFLFDAWAKGRSSVFTDELRKAAKSGAERLADVFKGHKTWKRLIEPVPSVEGSGSKGRYRLRVHTKVES